jgi:hypothetical protein
MIERTWTSKRTGEQKVGTYDEKIYYNTWYAKNKESLYIKNKCELCNGSYSQSNLSNHTKTKKHLKAVFLVKDITEKNLKKF